MSSRKANTVFHVKPRRTKFITLAYVPGALHNPKRMRRTPACCVDEEEAHLQKMLDAGVIQPSISEWASAPVLIRKRDGVSRYFGRKHLVLMPCSMSNRVGLSSSPWRTSLGHYTTQNSS
jgi:hypothetical protein